MKQPLAGILPVAPTPFHADGRVDEDGMRRVIDCMIDQGVDAICILANYSEQFLLSDEERALLMRISLEHAAGRVPMIVTISHFWTDLVARRAMDAEAMGAAMVMMMPPYHGSGLFQAGAAGYFRALRARSTMRSRSRSWFRMHRFPASICRSTARPPGARA
jgi:2-keto-3-deoxy-L-arabinonate dehydratase